MTQASNDDIAALCRAHMLEEERMLAAALPVVRALQLQFACREPARLAELVEQQQALMQLMRDMHERRRSLREVIAGRLKMAALDVRLSEIVQALPARLRESLGALLARVRRMADDLASTMRRLVLHLSIYLAAYQHLLRDLTGTDAGSGRYGRQGKADRPAYRPLIQIHG